MQAQYKTIRQKIAGILLICLFGVGMTFSGCSLLDTSDDTDELTPGDTTEEQIIEPPTPTVLTISAAGDIMMHSTQIKAQYDRESDRYQFDNNFQYVKPYIEQADLAICNVETTFGGKDRGYSGYPMFNAPDELAPSLSKAGFDVAVTANNHCLDTGSAGVLRTIEVLRQHGLIVAGTHPEGEPRFAIVTVKDVKIGIVAYTYETPQSAGRRSINAIPIPERLLSVINSFGYETLEEDTSRILQDMQDAKEAGAEVIVCVMHWGQEYQYTPTTVDKELAKQIIDGGAHVIFASHPHVIQPVEILNSTDGRQVPVFYSMGNFLSNQRADTVDNRKTEDGMIATVRLEILQGNVSMLKTSVLSTWVNKYDAGGKKVYEIIPIIGDYQVNPSIVDSRNQKSIEKSKEDSFATVGQWWEESY